MKNGLKFFLLFGAAVSAGLFLPSCYLFPLTPAEEPYPQYDHDTAYDAAYPYDHDHALPDEDTVDDIPLPDTDQAGRVTKQWGSNKIDESAAVAADGQGDIFVAGETSGGIEGTVNAGKTDLFLTRWNADASKAWTRQWGSTEDEGTNGMAIDAAGALYLTGNTSRLDRYPIRSDCGGGCLEGIPCSDAFLTKVLTDGTVVWSRQWGTYLNDTAAGVAVDADGNILVAGTTYGSLDRNNSAGDGDIFLTRWTAEGVKLWTKQWGSTGEDDAGAVAADAAGNIYVTGGTDGSLDGNSNKGGYCQSLGTGETANCRDAFLTKWNANGRKAWTVQWGTTGHDSGRSVALDHAGNVYVAGYTYGTLPGNATAGQGDAFLSKWADDGSPVWTKQWGSSQYDWGYATALDGDGNIYVLGDTEGDMDENPNLGGELGNSDVFLTRWNADGKKAWTKQWGSRQSDHGAAIAINGAGRILVSGYTYGSVDGNTPAGGINGAYGPDIFLTIWDP